jgi:hypothetical protein
MAFDPLLTDTDSLSVNSQITRNCQCEAVMVGGYLIWQFMVVILFKHYLVLFKG